jgi:Uma2 family endonuclease
MIVAPPVADPPAARRYTAEDLLRLPPDARYELIEGELVEMAPPPGAAHGNTTMRLSAPAAAFVLDNDLGECFTAETGFQVARDPDTVRACDFAFVAKERLPATLPKGYLPFAPDLVMETRSPSETKRMVADKVAMWLLAGARLVWVLDPQAQTVTVYRTSCAPQMVSKTDTLSGEDVLPGFTLTLARVFRPAAPLREAEAP